MYFGKTKIPQIKIIRNKLNKKEDNTNLIIYIITNLYNNLVINNNNLI